MACPVTLQQYLRIITIQKVIQKWVRLLIVQHIRISVKQNTLPLYVKYTDFPRNTTIHFIATQLHVFIQYKTIIRLPNKNLKKKGQTCIYSIHFTCFYEISKTMKNQLIHFLTVSSSSCLYKTIFLKNNINFYISYFTIHFKFKTVFKFVLG